MSAAKGDRIVGADGVLREYDGTHWQIVTPVPIVEPTAEKPAKKPKKDKSSKQGRELILRSPERWEEPITGIEVAEEIRETFRRFVAMPAGVDRAVTLWTLFSHAHDAFEISPILTLTSATMRCGKSTLLNVLLALVPRPLLASNISAASLFRVVENYSPTFLIDEADTFLKDDEDLRGLLNSGHTKAGAQVVRVEGERRESHLFTTWCPKAIALIDKSRNLPSTLEDRSVVVTLRRRHAGEPVERLRLDRLSRFEPIRQKAWTWAQDHLGALRERDPDLPEALNDRARDNWRPLVAVADQLGGDWPALARAAALQLSGESMEDTSPGALLLQDLRELFADVDKMTSLSIVSALEKMEDRPWPESANGRAITQRGLARMLKPFGIEPRDVRTSDGTKRGYYREDFEDAWVRYPSVSPTVALESATARQANNDAGESGFSDVRQEASVADTKSEFAPHVERSVALSREKTTPRGAEAVSAGDEPCRFCGGTEFWRHVDGGRGKCRVCHPPPSERAVKVPRILEESDGYHEPEPDLESEPDEEPELEMGRSWGRDEGGGR